MFRNAHIFQLTEGYSGSDIRLVAKEAAMRPVRKVFDALENHTEGMGCESIQNCDTPNTATQECVKSEVSGRATQRCVTPLVCQFCLQNYNGKFHSDQKQDCFLASK